MCKACALSFAGIEVWKEVRFYSVVCLLFLFSVSIVIWKYCLSINLSHTSKQRVHIRELTYQVREFCLKRAVNQLYQQGTWGHKTVFQTSWAVRWKEVRFFRSFVCCSLSVFRSSSENCLFIDLNHTSKQRVHVRELTHQARKFCLKRAINYISKGRGQKTVF